MLFSAVGNQHSSRNDEEMFFPTTGDYSGGFLFQYLRATKDTSPSTVLLFDCHYGFKPSKLRWW